MASIIILSTTKFGNQYKQTRHCSQNDTETIDFQDNNNSRQSYLLLKLLMKSSHSLRMFQSFTKKKCHSLFTFTCISSEGNENASVAVKQQGFLRGSWKRQKTNKHTNLLLLHCRNLSALAEAYKKIRYFIRFAQTVIIVSQNL